MIRVAFRYNDKRLFARAVCLLQGGDSAHCEAAWSWDGLLHECVSSSLLDGGVRGKAIDLVPGKWRIYELPGSYTAVTNWLELHKGERYDILGLLGFVFRRIKGWLRAWFCSEVVADIMQLPEPWRYDLALLESVCARFGRRVQ